MLTRLTYPVAEAYQKIITQGFEESALDYSKFGLKGHNGLDFGVPMNTPIYACAAGRVERVAVDPSGYGNYIKISHAWGVSLYCHLNCWMVKIGQNVAAGEVIGRSGSTGNSTGPHLHFEVRVSGEPVSNGYNGAVDPLPFLKADSPAKPEIDPPVNYKLYRSNGVNVRSEPSTERGDATIKGFLLDGVVIGVVAVTRGWANLGNGIYAAELVDGVQYLVPV